MVVVGVEMIDGEVDGLTEVIVEIYAGVWLLYGTFASMLACGRKCGSTLG